MSIIFIGLKTYAFIFIFAKTANEKALAVFFHNKNEVVLLLKSGIVC